jgi:ABC-type Mn2+/Zn2+ transport system ATPase subunit
LITGPVGTGKTTFLNYISMIISKKCLFDPSQFLYLPQKMDLSFENIRQVFYYPNVTTCSHSWFHPIDNKITLDMKFDECYVSHLLDIVGLSEMDMSKWKSSSSGEKQQLILTRIVHQQPEITIMDEPFSCMDYKTAEKSLLLCLEASNCVIISSHVDFSPIKNDCDFIMIKLEDYIH